VLDTSFLGRGWSFPVSFSKTGFARMSEHEDDIEESLRILLMTYPGERLMQPEYGSRLRDFCFESFSLRMETLIKAEIRRAVLMNEPRVEIDDISVVQTERIGVLQINVAYVVCSTNNRRNLVFPFYLNEATDANV
jgi:phage baseplate assembly protein W